MIIDGSSGSSSLGQQTKSCWTPLSDQVLGDVLTADWERLGACWILMWVNLVLAVGGVGLDASIRAKSGRMVSTHAKLVAVSAAKDSEGTHGWRSGNWTGPTSDTDRGPR